MKGEHRMNKNWKVKAAGSNLLESTRLRKPKATNKWRSGGFLVSMAQELERWSG